MNAMRVRFVSITLATACLVQTTLADEPNESLAVLAVSAETNEPLPGVGLTFHGRIGGQVFNQFVTTGRDGAARLAWPEKQEVNHLWMTASKPGFVPIQHIWRSEQRKIEMPARIDLRFETGTRIGGTIKDEQGQPIAGASLNIMMPVTWPKLANFVFTAASLTSDGDGKWAWDGAPAAMNDIGIRVEHAGYLSGGSTANQGMNNVAVLKRGLAVEGRVVDGGNKPVAGALARLCLDRFGTNAPEAAADADGRFVLKNCQPGTSLVTVEAEGFSPMFQKLTVSEQTKPLRFELQPGHTLSVQVTDINGAPLGDVWVVSDTWRGHRTLKLSARTDAKGTVVFRSAPSDAVLFDVLKQGYMSARRTPLVASDDTHKVTLYPELMIRGRVTDASTRQPVEQFHLRQGWQFANRKDVSWSRDEAAMFENGQYEIKFGEPMEGRVLQIVADGYLPATSRVFRSTEGKQGFDFELTPGTGPGGTVMLANGSPAAGAKVGLATQAKRAFLRLGEFDRRQNQAELVQAGPEGRFKFPPQGDDPFLLIVVHDGGYAERLSKELKPDEPIVLEPWGRIEGLVMRGRKPDPACEVRFQRSSHSPRSTFPFMFSYNYTAKTDEHGRFSFDRVLPGPGSVSRVVVTEILGSRLNTFGWPSAVDIRPGKMTKVAIGGSGRPVAGTVELKSKTDVAIDWTANAPAEIEAWDNAKNQRSDTFARYIGNLDAAGHFVVPDVPAGDYKLTIAVNNPRSPNTFGPGTAIGRAELTFSIPEMPGGRSDEPLDLGTVEATLFDTLDVGEYAPDFVVEQLAGGSLRMSKQRGKLVLLDFWATWCAPCVAELPAMRKLHEEFGGNPRFALISLSCDNTAEVAKSFVDEKKLMWQQAFIGGTHRHVAKAYTVRTLPGTFLVGPDGRVLAKDLRGEALHQAVAAALADDKLFDNAGRPFARFPIKRFEPAGELKPLAGKPGALVLDNSDPDYDGTKPHHDGLRLLSTTGAELWAVTDLHTGGSVGGSHSIALDAARGRIYVCESAAKRIAAFRIDGQRLWQVEQVEADTLAIDDKTGNLWSSEGGMLNDGETVVFDTEGNEVAAYPFRAIDLAYDPHDQAIWLAGYETIKLSREGKVLFRQRVDGWCCASVSVNPNDGSVWLAERQHPDTPRSTNRVWHLNSDGSLRHKIDVGEFLLFGVACVPRIGGAWITGLRDGLRIISPAGEVGESLPLTMTAYTASVSVATGAVWVAGEKEVLQFDPAGKILMRFPFAKPSQQCWVLAF